MSKGKTIAQMAILKWLEENINCRNLDIEFTDSHEAYITDSNGDSLTLIYDNATKEVYAL